MEVIIRKTFEDMSRAAAQEVADIINVLPHEKLEASVLNIDEREVTTTELEEQVTKEEQRQEEQQELWNELMPIGKLVLDSAERGGAPMPLASLLRDRFLTLLAHGGDNLDWSAIGGLAAKDAGA